MEKRQLIIVAAVAAISLLAVMIAAYISQQGSGGMTGAIAPKRFTARAGTTREKATVLTTRKRSPSDDEEEAAPTDPETEQPPPQSERKRPRPVRSLSSPGAEEDLTAEEELVRQALNTLTPEAGIEKLTEALKTSPSAQDAGNMQAALGLLYAQLDPPDFEKAQGAFDHAMELAPDPASRQDITKQKAIVLLQAGQADEAREQLEAAFDQEEALTSTWLELGVLLAQIHASAGETDKAEKTLRQTLDEALANTDVLDTGAADVLRLAGLRLAHLYRATGREDQAEALTTEMRPHLDALEQAE